jgi:drug/metabolite transporter superfamily protein YnfA
VGEVKHARIQFWLHNVGLPMLIVSMVIFTKDNHEVGISFAVLGGLLIIVSVILIVNNVFKRFRA